MNIGEIGDGVVTPDWGREIAKAPPGLDRAMLSGGEKHPSESEPQARPPARISEHRRRASRIARSDGPARGHCQRGEPARLYVFSPESVRVFPHLI